MLQTRILICLALLATLFIASAPCAAATPNHVLFQPVSSNVSPGQTFDLALVGRGFDHVIEGGGVNLQFNPARLKVVSVTVDSTTWEFFTQPGTINNTAGTITDLLFASFAGRTGDFGIATVRFQALTAGSVNLQLTQSAANPFASGGQLLPVTFDAAAVVVGGAPAPAAPALPLAGTMALALLLAGAALIGARRKEVLWAR